MAHQYSLAHLTVLEVAPPEMVEMASRVGYDYVSLRVIPVGTAGEPRYELARDADMKRRTKRAMDATGVRLLDVELARIVAGLDPKTYEPAMEVAAELGGKYLLSSVWVDDHNFTVDAFAELCSLAKPYGLAVCLEFVTWASVTDLKGAMSILREAGCENCGLMIDTLHFNRSRVEPEELDEVPREYFRFAHLCDGPKEIPADRDGLIFTGRDARLYVGEGGIDIAAILNRVPEMPYSIELPNVARVKEYGYEEHAKRCLESAKAYFAEHSRTDWQEGE